MFFQAFFASAKKAWERKQLQEPLLRKGFLKISPKGWGIRAFKARMLHTHENFHNAPPTERRGLFLCGVPAIYHHGRLCVVVIFSCAPTDGSAHRGDPVGICLNEGEALPTGSPLWICVTKSLRYTPPYPDSVSKPQKTKATP